MRMRLPTLLFFLTGAIVGMVLIGDIPPNPPLTLILISVGYQITYGLVVAAVSMFLWRVRTPRWARGVNLSAVISFFIIPALHGIRPQGDAVTLPAPEAPMCRVELLGLDGADLDEIERLIQLGQLPHFAQLLADGVSGPMRTISPHSPVVWTTIATGQPPAQHGVSGYTSLWLRGTDVLLPELKWDVLGHIGDVALSWRQETAVGSHARQARALWELTSMFGRSGLFLNWWASWPAEEISGVMVSNQALPWTSFEEAEITATLARPQITAPAEASAVVSEALHAYAATAGSKHLMRDAFSKEGSRFFIARDELVWQLRARLLSPEHQLVSPYLQEIDTSSHAYSTIVFGKNIDKKRKPKLSEPEASALWDELVGAAYVRMDQRIGELRAQQQANDCLIIVSDHGWAYDGTSHFRLPDGVFLAVGPPFRPGARLTDVEVYDVLPTVMALSGIPQSHELKGRVLTEAFQAAPTVNTIPTYGARRATTHLVEADDAHIERLKSLGYLQDGAD